MSRQEDRNTSALRAEYLAAQEKVREFDELLAEHDVPDPARFALRQWVEETIVGPVLEYRERVLRGVQRRN